MTLNMTRMNPISIHALREEGDIITDVRLTYIAISIHALREEGDVIPYNNAADASVFLSTPSARRATPAAGHGVAKGGFLSTPSARRATLFVEALHHNNKFLSTPSARRATLKMNVSSLDRIDFYPRPPRGGRLERREKQQEAAEFLSTPSARRATRYASLRFFGWKFLSTPSARRATFILYANALSLGNFYPRPPRGGRQQKQRENTLLLSHYTPPCTNCKEVSVKQAVKLHRCLHRRPLFQCEASRKTMCAACSHRTSIKRSAHYPVQTPGEVQRVRPWSGSCCPVGRTADCLRQGQSGRSALP